MNGELFLHHLRTKVFYTSSWSSEQIKTNSIFSKPNLWTIHAMVKNLSYLGFNVHGEISTPFTHQKN